MKRVLITFAGGQLALGVSRALKAAPDPIHIIGVDSAKFHLHQAEADEVHLVPRADDPRFIEVLSAVATASKADFIWPMHDLEVARVSAAAHSLPARTFLPAPEVTAMTQDKMATYHRLQEAEVPVPETLFIDTPADLAVAFDRFGGKVWLREYKGAGNKGAYLASDIQLAAAWLDIHDGWGIFTAAEYLPGPNDLSWESIWKDGKLIAAQSKTRLVRGAPGISISGVKSRSVIQNYAPPAVSEVAERAVRALMPQPNGIFRADMLADADGMPRVTEVDAGRFGSIGMAYWHRFGFNFPYQALKLGFDEPLDFDTPVINPFPTDVVTIGGINQDLKFVKLADVETKLREFDERVA